MRDAVKAKPRSVDMTWWQLGSMEDSRQKATQSDLLDLDQVVKKMKLMESVTRERSSLPVGCLQSCAAQRVGHWP